tara:strand:+ start:792 stop:1931 length:1140 start_codon:yes stop_codon:yes gene_type:complete
MKNNSANIVFRCDASLEIGNGHLMRCRTLAIKITQFLNARVIFICQEANIKLLKIIEKDFDLLILKKNQYKEQRYFLGSNGYFNWFSKIQKKDAYLCKEILIKNNIKNINLLVLDHYGIDKNWEDIFIKEWGINEIGKIFIIDDLANRKHNCDFLLDQTYKRKKKDYLNLLPNNATIFVGSEYALIRDEFLKARQDKIHNNFNGKKLFKILIYLGEVDNNLIYSEILDGIKKIFDYKFEVTLIANLKIEEKDKFKKIYESKFQMLRFVNFADEIWKFMLEADISIGAAGSTAWERACIGIPSIVIVNAENQIKIGNILKTEKCSIVINNDVNLANSIYFYLNNLISDEKLQFKLIQKSKKICDGKGADRIFSKIEEIFD